MANIVDLILKEYSATGTNYSQPLSAVSVGTASKQASKQEKLKPVVRYNVCIFLSRTDYS